MWWLSLVLFVRQAATTAYATASAPITVDFRDPCLETHNIFHPTPTTGVITSPEWPAPYPAPVTCTFNLTTSKYNVIHLVFEEVDIAPRSSRSHQCLDAHILIVVIDRHGRQHVGERMCGGDNIPRRLETMQAHVIVEFTAQRNTHHRGFRIEYQFINEASVRQPPSLYHDQLSSHEASCGGRNEPGSLSGEIVSPGFPITYPRNVTCHWLIRVQPSQRIYVRLVHLNFTDIKECELGAVSVADGYRHETPYDKRDLEMSEAKFCGNLDFYSEDGLKSYMSTENRIIIRLVTTARTPPVGSNYNKVGFKIQWTAVEGIFDESLPSSALENLPDTKCDQFVCDGGQICMDYGQGVCMPSAQLCIDRSLVCDGTPNCAEGDYSDELFCHSKEIMIAGAGGIFVVIIIIVIALFCERRRRKLTVDKALRRTPCGPRNGGTATTNSSSVWEESRRRPR